MSQFLKIVLGELQEGLAKVYGSRLRALRLFGSQARGDAVSGSDIDVALILDEFSTAGEEIDRTAPLVAEISLGHDCVISLVPVREKDWRIRQTPFLMNLRRESVTIL